jgi:predicted metal-dependent peptidase
MTKDEELAKISKDLMLQEPFYGLFLLMLNKEWTKKVPTAGVMISGINYKLAINEDFWSSLVKEHKQGLLKHELLHIAFYHLVSFEHLTNHDLANIAMDLEINQYIDAAKLPPGGQTLDLYPELDLKPKEGTIAYYEKLMKGAQNKSCPNLNKMLEGIGSGQMVVILDDGNGGETEVKCPNHDMWGEGGKDGKPISETTKRLMESQTKHLLNELADQVSKSRGTVPGEIQTILDKINTIEPPKFDWRGYLRRFTTGSIKSYTKLTRSRPNRRLEGLPAIKIKPKKHVLVAIDTSGSVSNDELVEFMQEINHIYKTGSMVTVVHADTAIAWIGPFDPKADWKVHGRGGKFCATLCGNV